MMAPIGGAQRIHLPTTPVADLIVHPRDGDLIAATHGRSFWVMEFRRSKNSLLQILSSETHLFTVKPAVAFDYRVFTNDEFLAEKRFIGENPPHGRDHQLLPEVGAIGRGEAGHSDNSGATVRELTATKEQGINRIQWDLRGKSLVQSGAVVEGAADAAGRARRRRARSRSRCRRRTRRSHQRLWSIPAKYVARLTVERPRFYNARSRRSRS